MLRISGRHAVGEAIIAVALAGCSPPVVLSDTDDYAHGTDLSIGQTADADGVLITVGSIAPGTQEPDLESDSVATIDVVATVENSTDTDLAGPDDCDEVLLQARVLSTRGGTDHIAQWSVPPEALG